MGDLIFLHHSHVPRCTATVDKRFEGYCSLQLMVQGEVELWYDRQRYELRGRWLWCCWPGPHVRFHRLGDCPWWDHRYLAFRGPLMQRWLDLGVLPPAPQPAEDARWPRRFDELRELASRPDRWGRLRAINLLEAILLEMAETQRRPGSTWLDEVYERLAAQDTLWPDYTLVARQMGIAQSTFRRRFREAAGLPLHHWAMQRRTDAAGQLLSQTDLPIKHIADRLGYRDVYYFSRQFRQQMGVTPGAYRRTARGGG